ncbi:hypothetical protein [Ferrimonas gelatinilytica]|uniref:hypothetical protein n=1 Tax=Ferrimonas gelatinilytica TaxID=1255257 RepID=UPI0031E9B55B
MPARGSHCTPPSNTRGFTPFGARSLAEPHWLTLPLLLFILGTGCSANPAPAQPTAPTAVTHWSISAAPEPLRYTPQRGLAPLPQSPRYGPPRPGYAPFHLYPPYSPATPPIRGLIPLQRPTGPIQWDRNPTTLPSIEQRPALPHRYVPGRQPVQPVPEVITPANQPPDYLTPKPPVPAVIGPPRRSPVQPRPLLRPVPPVVVPRPTSPVRPR